MSIDVDQPVGSSHILAPGDRVDLLVVFSQRMKLGQMKSIRTVAEAVKVFAVDQHRPVEDDLFPPHRISLLVTAEDATRIMLAKEIGRLSVALRPTTDNSRASEDELFSAATLQELALRTALGESDANISHSLCSAARLLTNG